MRYIEQLKKASRKKKTFSGSKKRMKMKILKRVGFILTTMCPNTFEEVFHAWLANQTTLDILGEVKI